MLLFGSLKIMENSLQHVSISKNEWSYKVSQKQYFVESQELTCHFFFFSHKLKTWHLDLSRCALLIANKFAIKF